MTEIIVAAISLIGNTGRFSGRRIGIVKNDKLSAFTVGKQSCRA